MFKKFIAGLLLTWASVAGAWSIAPQDRTLVSTFPDNNQAPNTAQLIVKTNATIDWIPAQMSAGVTDAFPSANDWWQSDGSCSPYDCAFPGFGFDVSYFPTPGAGDWAGGLCTGGSNMGATIHTSLSSNVFLTVTSTNNNNTVVTCPINIVFFYTGTSNVVGGFTTTFTFTKGTPWNHSGYLQIPSQTTLNPTWSLPCSINADASGYFTASYSNGYTCLYTKQWYTPIWYSHPNPGDKTKVRMYISSGDTNILHLTGSLCGNMTEQYGSLYCYVQWIDYAHTNPGDYQVIVSTEWFDWTTQGQGYMATSALVQVKMRHP